MVEFEVAQTITLDLLYIPPQHPPSIDLLLCATGTSRTLTTGVGQNMSYPPFPTPDARQMYVMTSRVFFPSYHWLIPP
jgi:hypothetical protein